MSNQRQKNNTQAKDAKQASAQKPAASPPNKRSSAASSAAEKHQTPAPTAAKPSAANTDSTSTSNTDSTTDSSLNNDMSRKNQKNTSAKNTPNTATKAAGHNADNQQDKAEQTNTNQPGDKNKEKANTNADKTNKADKPTKVNADTNTGAAEKKPDKKADNDHAVPAKKDHQPSPTPPPAAKNDKSGTGLVAKLALLLGVLGTVIAAYDYNEIRTLKSQNHSAELVAKLDAAEAKIAELSARNTDALEAKVTALANDAAALKTTGGRVNERLSAIEQTQNGLTKTLQGDLNATLDARLNEINALLKKVEQIEMTQEGLAQNLNQVTAAGEAVTAEGMARQEVGYLLRMADYKIDSEGDTVGAMGLLKIAEDKLLLLNQGQSDNLINAIRQKNIQLAGVKPVDPNAIISDLRAISRQVPNLIAKANAEATDSQEADMKKAATAGDSGVLASIGAVISSGVKYTPNDPSKIDISAETVLIEKRLMQADLRTAELAVRSQNQVLLAESLRSVHDSLDKYFAQDSTAEAINKALAAIEQRKLETVLPDLSPLVKQFEGRQ